MPFLEDHEASTPNPMANSDAGPETQGGESDDQSDASSQPELRTADPKSMSTDDVRSISSGTQLLPKQKQAPEPPLERTTSHNSSTAAKAKRQPSKRPQQHGRSQSNSRVSLALSTSSSSRPLGTLSRSKSTDLILRPGHPNMKRSNKSYTKLTSLHPAKSASKGTMNRAVNSLQPLTKTLLNGSLNRGSGGMHPLTKTILRDSAKHYALRKTVLNTSQKGIGTLSRNKSENSIKSNKSNTSLKGINAQLGGLKSSAKRGKAILKLNEEYPDEAYEDVSDDSEEGEDLASEQPRPRLERPDVRPNISSEGVADVVSSDGRSSATPYQLQLSPKNEPLLNDYKNTDSSSEDLTSRNMYGGSFLLSQSTGMTRKINPSSEPMDYAAFTENNSASSKALDRSGGGIVFKTGQARDVESEPVVTKTNAAKNSYHNNQTIFGNLQRTDLQFSNHKLQRPASEKSLQKQLSNKNFAGYLESNNGPSNSGPETRTQQKLWLQRENSLMDVSSNLDPSRLSNFSNLSLNKLMFAHNMSSANVRDMHLSRHGSSASHDLLNSKGETSSPFQNEQASNFNNFINIIQNVHQNSIQSRTEFERLNREYVNVRRHLNPVAASLGRIDQYLKHRGEEGEGSSQKKDPAKKKTKNETTESQEQYKLQLIHRLWQEALHTSSASSVSLRRYQDEQLLLQQQQQQQQQQEQETNRQGYESTSNRLQNEDASSARERLNRLNLNGTMAANRTVKSGGPIKR